MTNLLDTVDRLSHKVTPLSRLLDGMVARVVPHVKASACGCPVVCAVGTQPCGAGGYETVYECSDSYKLCKTVDIWYCYGGCHS